VSASAAFVSWLILHRDVSHDPCILHPAIDGMAKRGDAGLTLPKKKKHSLCLVWCLQFVIHIGYRNRWQFIFNSDHMQEEMSIFRIQQCREIVDDGPQSFPMGATNKEAASWAGLPQGQGRSVSRLPNAINFSVHQR
jgi:hypothetical protein